MSKKFEYFVYDHWDEYGDLIDDGRLVFRGSAYHVERFLDVKTQASNLAHRGTLVKGRYKVIAKEKKEDDYEPPKKSLDFAKDWEQACKHAKKYLHSENYRKKVERMSKHDLDLFIQNL